MRRAAILVATAAIVVGIAGYVAQFVAARWLGPESYTVFAVFWSVLFILIGTLSGVGQEVIRVSRTAKIAADAGLAPAGGTSGHPRIGILAVTIGSATAIVAFLTGLVWAPLAFGDDWLGPLTMLALGGIFVSGTLAVGSMAAGLARWPTYSMLVIVEGIARIVVFVVAALVLPSILGFSLAAVLAFLPALLIGLLWAPLRRDAFSLRSDSPVGMSSTRILRSMAASGLSSVLVVGWPTLLSAAAGANPRGSTSVSLGVLILLVTLTRAPLMVPLTSFQNVLVARFTGLDLAQRRRWVSAGIGLIAAASAVLAGLAALFGPPLLPLIFGDQYQADPGIVAALTAAAAGLGIITLTGVAAITSEHHSLYLAGWATALVVALVTLFAAPLPFEWATVAALLAGPGVGAIVQLFALRRPARA